MVSSAGFSATRVGGEVRLRWTTAKQTTDKLPTRGVIQAEICRRLVSGTASPQKPTCIAVARLTVAPGETAAVDPLPAALTEGSPQLLAYRVQLLNSAGRTAGPSPAVYVAAGAAPPPVVGFTGETTPAGIELHWQQQAAAGTVELDRTLLDPVVKPAASPAEGLLGSQKQAVDVRLRAGDPGAADAGGMVDRTVELGHRYQYTAQRVERVVVAGQTLELRSAPSAAQTFELRDVFPPAVPQGLIAVPGFFAQKPSIDLSWEPVVEQDVKPKVAGYKVYRRDDAGEAWRLLGAVTAPAYRDAAVVVGQRYTYRVTAVSTAGNESAASSEAAETAPQVQP